MEVSKSLLEWREGDAITSEHRDAVAAKLAAALHIFAYNFLTVHSSLKETPAQASDLAENVWTWGDLFAQ